MIEIEDGIALPDLNPTFDTLRNKPIRHATEQYCQAYKAVWRKWPNVEYDPVAKLFKLDSPDRVTIKRLKQLTRQLKARAA